MTSYAFPTLLKPSFAPFDELDFGLSSGLSVPFSKEDYTLSQALHTERVDPIRYQAVNHRDGIDIATVGVSRLLHENTELSALYRSERCRHDVYTHPSLDWNCHHNVKSKSNPKHTSSSALFREERFRAIYPDALVHPSMMAHFLNEDRELFQIERRNPHRGNLVQSFEVNVMNTIPDPVTLPMILFATGPSLNVASLASVTRRHPEQSWSLSGVQMLDLETELTAFSAIEPIGELSSSFERLVTASTTTEHLHLLRLCSLGHTHEQRQPESEEVPGQYDIGFESLDALQCGAQLLTAFTNPSIISECAFVTADARLVVWDVNAARPKQSIKLCKNDAVWMRGTYTRHPRVMMLAHRRNLLRLDLRERAVEDRAGLLPTSRPLVINGFEKSPLHMFQFALQSWEHVCLYDERYLREPLLRWSHKMLADRPANLFFLSCDARDLGGGGVGEEVPAHSLLGSFGALRSERELHVCRFSLDGSPRALSGMQKIDGIAEMDPLGIDKIRYQPEIAGAAFVKLRQSTSSTFATIKLSDCGNLWMREFNFQDEHKVAQTVIDCAEDPEPQLLRSQIVRHAVGSGRSLFDQITGRNEVEPQRRLDLRQLTRFFKDRKEDIEAFFDKPKLLGEVLEHCKKRYDMEVPESAFALREALDATCDISIAEIFAGSQLPDRVRRTSPAALAVSESERIRTSCYCLGSLSLASQCHSRVCVLFSTTLVLPRSSLLDIDYTKLWNADLCVKLDSRSVNEDVTLNVDALMNLLSQSGPEETSTPGESQPIPGADADAAPMLFPEELLLQLNSQWNLMEQNSDDVNVDGNDAADHAGEEEEEEDNSESEDVVQVDSVLDDVVQVDSVSDDVVQVDSEAAHSVSNDSKSDDVVQVDGNDAADDDDDEEEEESSESDDVVEVDSQWKLIAQTSDVVQVDGSDAADHAEEEEEESSESDDDNSESDDDDSESDDDDSESDDDDSESDDDDSESDDDDSESDDDDDESDVKYKRPRLF